MSAAEGKSMTDEKSHVYLSTACLHGLHDKCRLTCKYCGEPCWCTSPECIHNERGEVVFAIAASNPGDSR